MLIQLRKDAGVTQVELAARLATTQAFISKYEVGGRRIDLAEFVEISRALGTEPSNFIQKYEVALKKQLG